MHHTLPLSTGLNVKTQMSSLQICVNLFQSVLEKCFICKNEKIWDDRFVGLNKIIKAQVNYCITNLIKWWFRLSYYGRAHCVPGAQAEGSFTKTHKPRRKWWYMRGDEVRRRFPQVWTPLSATEIDTITYLCLRFLLMCSFLVAKADIKWRNVRLVSYFHGAS